MDSERDPFASKLRLFLSVDIQGSTAFKYDSAKTDRWLLILHRFYTQFDDQFRTQWNQLHPRAPQDWKHVCTAAAPEFWKAAGDELLFVQELNHPIDALISVDAFCRQVLDHDNILRGDTGGKLRLKPTAWTAGFPVANLEIPIGGLSRIDVYPRGKIEQRAAIAHSARKASEGRRDFVGTSIDTGFRLTRLATPRKLVLSVELALLLAEMMVKHSRTNFLSIQYEEGEMLKGVLESAEYPRIWIDLEAGNQPNKASEKLLKRDPIDLKDLIQACRDFITSNRALFLPYILHNGRCVYGAVPTSHKTKLRLFRSRAQREAAKEKAAVDQQLMSDEGGGREPGPFKKKILSSLSSKLRSSEPKGAVREKPRKLINPRKASSA